MDPQDLADPQAYLNSTALYLLSGMRLFFYNKSRAFKGYLRGKNTPDLDFYKKNRLKKTRLFHHQIFDFHLTQFIFASALFMSLFWSSLNLFFNDPFYLSRLIWKIDIEIPTTQNSEDFEYRNYFTTIILSQNGELFLMDSKIEYLNETYGIQDYYFTETDKIIALYIDENTEMRYVNQLLNELKETEITQIYFMTKKPGN